MREGIGSPTLPLAAASYQPCNQDPVTGPAIIEGIPCERLKVWILRKNVIFKVKKLWARHYINRC